MPNNSDSQHFIVIVMFFFTNPLHTKWVGYPCVNLHHRSKFLSLITLAYFIAEYIIKIYVQHKQFRDLDLEKEKRCISSLQQLSVKYLSIAMRNSTRLCINKYRLKLNTNITKLKREAYLYCFF